MKIIFLDVDGVLNSAQYLTSRKQTNRLYWMLDEEKIKLLKDIIKKTDASIVLSSSWRGSFDEAMRPNSSVGYDLENALKAEGLSLYDKTSFVGRSRYDEIKDWVLRHDVSNFVILDDMIIDWKDYSSNVVQTNIFDGLTRVQVHEAIQILETK